MIDTKMDIQVWEFEVPDTLGINIADETYSVKLSTLNAETLSRLCDDFRRRVFEAAGAVEPPTNVDERSVDDAYERAAQLIKSARGGSDVLTVSVDSLTETIRSWKTQSSAAPPSRLTDDVCERVAHFIEQHSTMIDRVEIAKTIRSWKVRL